MGLAVPGRVERRVLESEVSGDVDHDAGPLADVGNELLALAVWQGEEHDVETVRVGRVEAGEHEIGIGTHEARVQLGHARTGLRVSCRPHEIEVGMLGNEAEELGASVPGRAHDADGSHVPSIPTDSCTRVHDYADAPST